MNDTLDLEPIFRELWGHVLSVSLRYPKDEKVQESFREVDRLVRAAGLMDE